VLIIPIAVDEESGNITGHTQEQEEDDVDDVDDNDEERRPKMLATREAAKDVFVDGFAAWTPESRPKRRITSEVVTTMEMRMRTMMIHVWSA
jgi:hypothetical protein